MILKNNTIEPFFGVVEDRSDPTPLGRVRVRVYGVHPFGKAQGDVSGLPTEELQWMQVLLPATSASTSGIGTSPTGLLEGSHVFGIWLDKYKTNGLVMGTWAGSVTELPNTSEGFSDPTGLYPTKIGYDTNPLAQGGEVGKNSEINQLQNDNTSIAPNPIDGAFDDQPEDNDPNFTIEKMLRGDEGLRLAWYPDSEGYPTIGIGHLLRREKTKDTTKINKWISDLVGRQVNNGRITMDEASKIFQSDIKKTINGMKANATISPVYNKMNRSRQMALENMAFQMGVGGLAKFKKTLALMYDEKWEEAYNNMRDSLWFRQTKGRASRVSLIVRTGNLESYGVTVPTTKMRAMAFSAREMSPEDPYTPEDGRIMFEEPNTSYDAVYPYNQTFTTEGDITQEFDNTPGAERYRLRHPSGTYTELSGNGDKVLKVTGDDYTITAGDGHVLIQGDAKIVIGSQCKVYIQGDESKTVDGMVNHFVRGDINTITESDSNTKVNGDMEVLVLGNKKITVEGDADINVQGNATTKVDGDYSMEVAGDYTLKIGGAKVEDVTGSFTQTMQTMSSVAKSGYKIDGSRIDLG
ncbi:baseplate hub subunit and tail lysozyme [Morganella phage vB_MmoM_MP1]|uniref:Baseplate central spike protein n=1 Tax=Morganella phage vB_MmoM_MP1 TaxID=1852628 RepID=A0A192YA26_9CAUD|nr:baseplate hub subunit and tail lysozyme [Morganella phage vB_MmoM_MP1]ANM46407.1 baseplate hub subunit and tail lysozyme [Morganella phage vB_MmoM_MP1]